VRFGGGSQDEARRLLDALETLAGGGPVELGAIR
jgi:hypothetical protein